jgi:hypothetical protein
MTSWSLREGVARPNTLQAYAHDLRTFFAVVGKESVPGTLWISMRATGVRERLTA